MGNKPTKESASKSPEAALAALTKSARNLHDAQVRYAQEKSGNKRPSTLRLGDKLMFPHLRRMEKLLGNTKMVACFPEQVREAVAAMHACHAEFRKDWRTSSLVDSICDQVGFEHFAGPLLKERFRALDEAIISPLAELQTPMSTGTRVMQTTVNDAIRHKVETRTIGEMLRAKDVAAVQLQRIASSSGSDVATKVARSLLQLNTQEDIDGTKLRAFLRRAEDKLGASRGRLERLLALYNERTPKIAALHPEALPHWNRTYISYMKRVLAALDNEDAWERTQGELQVRLQARTTKNLAFKTPVRHF